MRDGLKSDAPKDWKVGPGSNEMRVLEAKLAKAEGDADDAELVVFFFGKGGGGGVADNIKRWKGQVVPPEGKTADDISKVTDFKVGDKVKATYLNMQAGTYAAKARPVDPKSPTTQNKNYRLLGVVFESDGGPFFIKVTGPAKTIEKHEKAFEAWVKNFK